MEDLDRLAELLKRRNAVEKQITALIQRPVTTGHLGEYIASKIFEIQLMDSASHKGFDGHFLSGSLAGRSVNIKFHPKLDGLVDISSAELDGFILVLAGPKIAAASSKGRYHPCAIELVFLFDTKALVTELNANGTRLGLATSVKQHLWQKAEIYPTQRNSLLILSEKQRSLLALFKSNNIV